MPQTISLDSLRFADYLRPGDVIGWPQGPGEPLALTEALVAHVVVSKYADHLPLYRQAQILARHGVHIERSTLADWVGAAAAELEPLYDHLVRTLKSSPNLLICLPTRRAVLCLIRGQDRLSLGNCA